MSDLTSGILVRGIIKLACFNDFTFPHVRCGVCMILRLYFGRFAKGADIF